MSSYLANHTITVLPFTQKRDGDETIIANASSTAFLSLPSSAVDILHWLMEGKTVGEAQALYHKKYQELPDIGDFLELLESEGFVISKSTEPVGGELPPRQEGSSSPALAQPRTRGAHFSFISQDLARRIFCRPVLYLCFLCIASGFFLAIIDRSLIPPPTVFVFKQNLTFMSIGLFLLVFPAIFLHEIAHLVAARAAGVPARLGISHRLWIIVAQTDMTGIWMASKRQRLLAVLAGSLLDATIASLLLLLLFLQQRAWVHLSPELLLFCRIILFTYLLRLLWECYLFVRTDFYYVIAIAFNCKDLMGDTQAFLRNQCARVFPFVRRVDQSRIPAREMRVVRAYALVWIVGRGLAFSSLLFISLSILLGYYREIGTFLLRGQIPGSFAPADIAGWFLLVAVSTGLQTAGFVLWIRSFFVTRRVTHAQSQH